MASAPATGLPGPGFSLPMAYYYSPFRKKYTPKKTGVCPFCDRESLTTQIIANQDNILIENDQYLWAINAWPKFEGHTLIVPKRHYTKLIEETDEEILSRHRLMTFAESALGRLFPGSGVEVFLQTGPGSASSVEHIHWHLVPAHPDDQLRSFEKLGHFYTTEKEQEKIVLFPLTIQKSPEELRAALAKVIASDRLSA